MSSFLLALLGCACGVEYFWYTGTKRARMLGSKGEVGKCLNIFIGPRATLSPESKRELYKTI